MKNTKPINLECSPLLTDLYELTMLQTYYEHDMTANAVFELFLRQAPSRRFFVAAGLETAVNWLTHLQFKPQELEWMKKSGLFSTAFIDRMADFRFTGDLHAIAEGQVFFPEEPLIQIVAPLPEAQFIESRLMNIIHYQTLIASKAIRCTLAARGVPVVDFGMRRAHGGEAGLWAARACYLAGFASTATCLGSARYNIPPAGTMAHAFILAHDSEMQAFERFARSHPNNVVLLIDTYNVARGAERVVALAKRLVKEGIQIHGVRIDSGDLVANAKQTRAILDNGGLNTTRIIVSGGLDEHRIAELIEAGAPIDGIGVGSNVDTSADAPFLDSAYKLHYFNDVPRVKHAEGKTDLPGRKQVFRSQDADGKIHADTLALSHETLPGEKLIQPVMRAGNCIDGIQDILSLEAARERCMQAAASLPEGIQSTDKTTAPSYPVILSRELQVLQSELRDKARAE